MLILSAAEEAEKIDIPCGCHRCGCLCAEHAPDRMETFCERHGFLQVAADVAGEAAMAVSLASFGATMLLWALLLGS